MKKFLILPILVIFASCCTKEAIPDIIINEDGVVVKQPCLWKTSLTNGSYVGTFVKPSFMWNEKMLFGAETDNSSELALLDINTGEIIWKKPYANKENASIDGGYQKNGIAIVEAENAKFRGLNIENGEFLWSFNEPGWFWPSDVSGIENTFFLCGQTQTIDKPYELWSAWCGNIETGEVHEFFVPDILKFADTSSVVANNRNIIGGVKSIVPFISSNNDLFAIIYHSTFFESVAGEYYISLYNFTNKEFVYQDIRLSSGSDGTPHIVDDKIYFTLGDGIYCYDLYTAEIIWNKPYPYRFTNFGFLAVDGKIIAMQHELTGNSYLVCVDMNTKYQMWKTASHQCDAPMRYLNGVVYFVSSGDCKLHAYDAQTGKQLWHIVSPDYEHDSGAFFKPECTVVPGKDGEKGKVIVSSYLNGFCFEAIK